MKASCTFQDVQRSQEPDSPDYSIINLMRVGNGGYISRHHYSAPFSNLDDRVIEGISYLPVSSRQQYDNPLRDQGPILRVMMVSHVCDCAICGRVWLIPTRTALLFRSRMAARSSS